MIKIKHFMDAREADDGQRLWVEPIGLTKDLCEWCSIDEVVTHLGPPMALWEWFDRHPRGYEHFRGKYHEHLEAGPYRKALVHLARAGVNENFTLVYQGDDPGQNTATALYEYLTELAARVSGEE